MPLILIIEGPTAPKQNNSVNEYLDYLIYSWGHYNGGGVTYVDGENINWEDFKEVKKGQPPPNTRSEVRKAWYRDNPYMRNLPEIQLFQYGAKLIDSITPNVMKGGPKLPQEQLGEMFLQFDDFIEEINCRGLDLKQMKKYHNK